MQWLNDYLIVLRVRFATWRLLCSIRHIERADPAQGRWMRLEARKRLAGMISDEQQRTALLAQIASLEQETSHNADA